MNQEARYLAIILAAGVGSRLDFDGPKSLFPIDNKPMIDYTFSSLSDAGSIDLLTVVGHKKDQVIKHIENRSSYLHQSPLLGTGHAAMKCISQIEKYDNTFVFVADAPFVSRDYIYAMMKNHIKTNSDCTFLYSKFPIELPYGRLIFDASGKLKGLVEEHDADLQIKKNNTYFTSQYLFKSKTLIKLLSLIEPDKKTGEYNLTETINIMLKEGSEICPLYIKEYWNLMGINSIEDLSYIQGINE